jgi:hypothetical protein
MVELLEIKHLSLEENLATKYNGKQITCKIKAIGSAVIWNGKEH